VTAVRIYDRRLRWPVPRDLPRRLVGRVVDRVDRRSKYLLFRLGADTLIVHFGMTGSLRVYGIAPARRTHDHIDLEFANGVVLRYHDPRRFGAMLWSPATAGEHPLLAALGPEPFSAGFDEGYLFASTRKRSTAIKLALMDNRLVVGVGNIYANEALFRAGIRPTRASTLRDYVDSDGAPGYFQLEYNVYGREGQPCRVCGVPIRTIRQGGRATYYCHGCQT
jgi:formamidopyrimidine-DNA glycosylase